MFLFGKQFKSRLIMGSALYPTSEMMQHSFEASGTEIVTVALRRHTATTQQDNPFWKIFQSEQYQLMPNTSGCYEIDEVITLAHMARDLFQTDWIKLEIIGDEYTLQPDTTKIIEAARELIACNFKVLPYCTEDLVIATHLVNLGCEVLMPWGAPIGTGQGLLNPYMLKTLRHRFPDTTLIVDAGIGKPSDAVQAMELGYDAVLTNTAIAESTKPVAMARAFKLAVEAGREAYEAQPMQARDMAQPSTTLLNTPFWHKKT